MCANVALAVQSSQSKFTQHYAVSCIIRPYLLQAPCTNNTIARLTHGLLIDVDTVPCICIDRHCWCFSLDPSELDLDGEGGCKFLRVMLSLIMHDYPQLVYGALELLFRHFSQRQEVLQAFKQVRIEVQFYSLSGVKQ